MPCEKCNAQFTVFKRKKNCTECMRYYCNQCLVKRYNGILCERCLIFTKRPLDKIDLLKLKPKDLIFYLQSKHISTTGCVEKEELVSLILAHVNSTDTFSGSNGSRGKSDNSNGTGTTRTSNTPQSPKEFPSKNYSRGSSGSNESNPFDNLKNTCQNFFNSFTEKIASDLNIITDAQKKNRSNSTTSSSATNISDQPRITKREIPSYSHQRNSFTLNQERNLQQNPSNLPNSPNSVETHSSSSTTTTSSPSSPVNSLSSTSSQNASPQQNKIEINKNENSGENNGDQNQSGRNEENGGAKKPPRTETPNIHKTANNHKIFFNVINSDTDSASALGSNSGCECSDDEIITKYRKQKSKTKLDKVSPKTSLLVLSSDTNEPSTSTQSPSSNNTGSATNSLQTQEDSSGSSFEELNGNAATSSSAGVSSTSDIDSWQIVDKDAVIQSNPTFQPDHSAAAQPRINSMEIIEFDDPSNFGLAGLPSIARHQRRISRRRSDGYIINQNRAASAIADVIDCPRFEAAAIPIVFEEESDGEASSESRKRRRNCHKCGKNKTNLKKRIAKFRKQLESSEISEQEIKRELESFFEYLENRSKSIDNSDSDNGPVGATEERSDENHVEIVELTEEELRRQLADDYEERFLNDNDGIHVYAHDFDQSNSYPTSYNNGRFDRRFLNLQDFKLIDEFEELSVKQLKEILMLNRIDYKGCCEKKELLDRVHRLWKDLQECPAVEKLPTDDLCKICMDAAIECVLLECGHVCTCTNCGKVLNECPICRQYIVRVVRFFRA